MVNVEEIVNFPIEFFNSLQAPRMPLHCLRLKVLSPMILLRNRNSPKLCHGTSMIAKYLLNNIIEAELMTEKQKDTQYVSPEHHRY
ncbi:hypothetical protein X975_00530, partial [Stegodyphus mimosarum]